MDHFKTSQQKTKTYPSLSQVLNLLRHDEVLV